MKILTISTLYPNREMPNHGIFVENRLLKLIDTGCVKASVIAPVPWFPAPWGIFGDYGRFARVPKSEMRNGLQLAHPRYLAIPKIGMSIAPILLYHALRRHVLSAIDAGHDFDLIDAHYVYPDGVAATWLGKDLGKPVVVTARGTDLHLLPQYLIPRKLITDALQKCTAIVAVSQALADCARALAGDEQRIEVLRNGVDLELFQETDRQRTRQELNLTGPTLLSVGLLIPRKGHELVIEALTHLPATRLLICGEGPMKAELERKAKQLGVSDRICFLGRIAHDDLSRYYSAADVLILASFREGWPNVLLEAMACGTPVVATAVGAVPDFVDHPDAGRVVYDRTASSIASAVSEVLDNPPLRSRVRQYATNYDWNDTTQGLLDLFLDMPRQRAT